MKKVLMIFSRPPYPLIGGDKIRMYQVIKMLSSKYKIDIVFINDTETEPEITTELKKFAENVYNFDFKKPHFILNTMLGFVLGNKPLQVNYYYFKKVQRWIDNNIQNYDAVFCSSIRTSEYVYQKPIYKIIDFIDAISMNYQKAYEKSSFGIWKLLYKIDKERLKTYEKRILPHFDQRFIISEVDRSFMVPNGNYNNFNILFNSVDIDTVKQYSCEEENYIIFVGKMDYEPNINAVKYFSTKVFPSIQKIYPDLKFYIAGVKPTPIVKKLDFSNEKIVVTGFVEDLNMLMVHSKLVVAPMVSGAGIQNKILQAMALKKCVVTTPIGAEGLNAAENEIVISSSTENMISDINSLLSKSEERQNIGKEGYNYVKNNFSQSSIQEKLLSLINI